MTIRTFVAVAISVAAPTIFLAAPAQAAHDHYVVTPNGECHQVAQGQTGISDPSHGGYHKFHTNVHVPALAYAGALGSGHSEVFVFRDDCVYP